MNQDQTYQHDYTVDIKQLQVVNREQALVWDTMIESYQKKIIHLKKKLNIEKTQEIQRQNQQDNKQQLYQQQCLLAANSYQIDLFELRKKDLQKQFELRKAILKEQINENIKSYEQISKNLQPLPQEQPKECSFITGACSEYTLVLALHKKNNQKTFISLQSFYPECYISNSQDCEDIQLNLYVVIYIYISYKASKNSIQNKLLLANADNRTLNCYMVSYDKDKLSKDLLFQQELQHNIDLIHITKTLQIIVISKLGGFVYLLNKNQKQLIYQGDHVIGESAYFENTDILRVSNQNKIITISNLLTHPEYDQLLLQQEKKKNNRIFCIFFVEFQIYFIKFKKYNGHIIQQQQLKISVRKTKQKIIIINLQSVTEKQQYSALIYYHTNLHDFHLMYIQHPQIINKEYFVYVKKNEVRVFDYVSQEKKKFKVPTQNIQIEFLNYFEKTNKLVFCDSQGQTYKVEKFTNLIG